MMLDLNLILKCFLHTSMLLFIAKLYFFRYGHNLRMFSGLQEIEHLYFNARPMETLSLKSIRKVLPFTSSETKKKKNVLTCLAVFASVSRFTITAITSFKIDTSGSVLAGVVRTLVYIYNEIESLTLEKLRSCMTC